MLIAIILGTIGLVVGSFTILPVLICLVFGIQTTKKLERESMLVNNHPIIKRYWISIGILTVIFIVILGFIYIYGSIHALRGYIGGSALAVIVGIWKIGKNTNNISDYVSTQSRYFTQPVENVIDFLNR